MSKLKNQVRPVFAYAFALALVFGASNAMAETIKKLHSSPQLVINLGTSGSAKYGMVASTQGTSTTIDLSGADLDKISIGVLLSSYTGTAPTLTLQGSPDGGSTWFTNGAFTVNLTTADTVALTTYYANVDMMGNKARLTTTLAASTTVYTYKVWATPSVK